MVDYDRRGVVEAGECEMWVCNALHQNQTISQMFIFTYPIERDYWNGGRSVCGIAVLMPKQNGARKRDEQQEWSLTKLIFKQCPSAGLFRSVVCYTYHTSIRCVTTCWLYYETVGHGRCLSHPPHTSSSTRPWPYARFMFIKWVYSFERKQLFDNYAILYRTNEASSGRTSAKPVWMAAMINSITHPNWKAWWGN